MRHLILTTMLALTAVPAMASSIEVVGASKIDGNSIVTLSCAACPAPNVEKRKPDYTVPVLAEGTQSTEIREIAGQKTLRRTEAWRGGSPVVSVSKADAWFDQSAATADNADGIDLGATTSAVGRPAAASATAVLAGIGGSAPPAPLDLADFNLRLE